MHGHLNVKNKRRDCGGERPCTKLSNMRMKRAENKEILNAFIHYGCCICRWWNYWIDC